MCFVLALHHAGRKCDFVSVSKEALGHHMKKKHSHGKVKRRFRCKVCSFSSDKSTAVQVHTRSHSLEKSFRCYVCFKKFVRKCDLRRHFNSTHSFRERPYECSVCSKRFLTNGVLNEHIRLIHHKLKHCTTPSQLTPRAEELLPYKCLQCSSKFRNVNSLKEHFHVAHQIL